MLLEVRELRPRVRTPVSPPVSFVLGAGETVAISGPSGAGKSLLLRALADLDPSDGEVLLEGRPRASFAAPQWRRRVAYLAPESAWWFDTARPHFLRPEQGGGEAHDGEQAPALPEPRRLGLPDGVLDAPLDRLSSGERQRLALLRLLAHRPRVLLLDEPTARLDGDSRALLEGLIDEVCRDSECAALWVSHDPEQRSRVASRTLAMAPDGSLEADA